MSITGNLKTMEFAELLQWLARGQKSGTLLIDNGRVEKRIFFKRGTIISSASSDPKEYLGHFLVSHGFISEEELSQVMELQRSKKTLLGKILVTIGVISQQDLEYVLRFKAEESIYDIFSWPAGDFRFLDNDLPPNPMVPIALDVTAAVLNGIQRQDEWAMVRERIPSLQAVPVVVGELEMPEEEGARNILSLVDDDRSIEEIALLTHATEFYVCRVLFDQLRQGRLKVVRPRGLKPAPLEGGVDSAEQAADDTLPEVGDDSPGSIQGEALLRTAEQHLRAHQLDSALRHVLAARSLEPESRQVQRTAKGIEDRIRREMESDGVVMEAVVHLTRPIDELQTLGISPQEGFILSRANGTYDVETILKITPMPRLEAQTVLWKLLSAGHIRLARR